MPITDDIRSYADSAVNQAVSQGKQAVNQGKQALSSAQAQLNSQLNIEAIRTAVEPYVSQVKGYGDTIADRVEEIFETLRKDPRFAKLLDTAGSVSEAVSGPVQDYVVKPVASLTGIGKSAGSTPAAKAPRKPAATKPATPKPATKATTKPVAKKTTATKKTTAAKPAADA